MIDPEAAFRDRQERVEGGSTADLPGDGPQAAKWSPSVIWKGSKEAAVPGCES